MTTQLRLLSGGELPRRVHRPMRALRPRPSSGPAIRLDARTREIGRSGIAEARRRLAEITAHDGAEELVRAS